MSNILTAFYKLTHPGVKEDNIPYWYKRSILEEVWHLIRKGICQNIAPNCVFTPVGLCLYRLCGFKIGKIGENAVVGAGSLVLHSVPPNTVYAGNPARFIKENNRK